MANPASELEISRASTRAVPSRIGTLRLGAIGKPKTVASLGEAKQVKHAPKPENRVTISPTRCGGVRLLMFTARGCARYSFGNGIMSIAARLLFLRIRRPERRPSCSGAGLRAANLPRVGKFVIAGTDNDKPVLTCKDHGR